MTCPWSTAFLIVRKSPSHPAAGEDDFAAARLRFSPGYDGRGITYAVQGATEFLNGTMLQESFICRNRASTISCLWAEVLPG